MSSIHRDRGMYTRVLTVATFFMGISILMHTAGETDGIDIRERWMEEDREVPSFPCNMLNYDDT